MGWSEDVKSIEDGGGCCGLCRARRALKLGWVDGFKTGDEIVMGEKPITEITHDLHLSFWL